MKNKLIWIIDRQHWPRALLRAELMERGYDVEGFEELSLALLELREHGGALPRVTVLELREQDIKQEELDKLIRTGIPLIVLGGETELNDKIIKKMHHRAAVMKRPLTIGEVADKVEEILKKIS
jgi:DNA-binding NtrC family response regulator